MENTNFKNDIFNKKNNLRDYDKELLIIKDKTVDLTKMFSVVFIFIDFLKYFSPYREATAYKYGELGDCYIKFRNSNIQRYSTKKNAILNSINFNDIVTIKRTYAPSEPSAKKEMKIFAWCVVLVTLFLSVARFAINENLYLFLLIPILFFVFITPIVIYKIKNNLEFYIADSVIFYSKYTFIELSLLSRNEYNEIKRYFLSKTGINLDKIMPEIFI